MSSKLHSLKQRSAFVRIAKSGTHVSTKGIMLQAMKHDAAQDEAFRVGITVTKKIGNAVMRNTLRRRMRVIARDVLASLQPQCEGWDYVIVVRKAATERSFDQLRKDFTYAVHQVLESSHA